MRFPLARQLRFYDSQHTHTHTQKLLIVSMTSHCQLELRERDKAREEVRTGLVSCGFLQL